jgi:Protein of unknown function (DUF4244)
MSQPATPQHVRPARFGTRWLRLPLRPGRRGDAGTTTAEYAMVIVVAVGFASMLLGVMSTDTVKGLLEGIVRRALSGA